ncbi:MAG: nucleoside triphosphate pyrophosphohydrolase [Thiotrichales bacterium]
MSQAFDELIKTFAALRDPVSGCPWDLEQTHESLIPYLLEETYEVIEALEHGKSGELKDELGDLLLQIAFHAQLAAEQNRFDLNDVAKNLTAKLIRRHPHVFADQQCPDAESGTRNWEAIKQQEKPKPDSALDGIVVQLPALMYAQKLQRKAAKAGFDWPDYQGVLDKIREEIEELQVEIEADETENMEAELGDVLFSVVNLARHLGIDSENALRKSANKFSARFRSVEQQARNSHLALSDCDAEILNQYWNQAKQNER